MSDYADNLRKSMINKTRRFMRMVQEMQEKDDAALREQVIRMAREAGGRQAKSHELYDYLLMSTDALERFFLLAAAAGAAAEREACAKVCDLMEQQAEGTDCCKWPTPIDCAAAIRARSKE